MRVPRMHVLNGTHCARAGVKQERGGWEEWTERWTDVACESEAGGRTGAPEARSEAAAADKSSRPNASSRFFLHMRIDGCHCRIAERVAVRDAAPASDKMPGMSSIPEEHHVRSGSGAQDNCA